MMSEEFNPINFVSLLAAAEVHSPQKEQCVLSIDQKFNSESIDRYKWAALPEVWLPQCTLVHTYMRTQLTRTLSKVCLFAGTRGGLWLRRCSQSSKKQTSVTFFSGWDINIHHTSVLYQRSILDFSFPVSVSKNLIYMKDPSMQKK